MDRIILILWKPSSAAEPIGLLLQYQKNISIRSAKISKSSPFAYCIFFSMQTLTATVWAAQTTTKWLGALEAICGDGPRRHRRWCSIRYLWAHLSYPWVYLLSRPTTTLSLYTNCTYAFEDQHVTLEYCLSFLGGYWIHMGVLMGLGSWWDRRRPPSPLPYPTENRKLAIAFSLLEKRLLTEVIFKSWKTHINLVDDFLF